MLFTVLFLQVFGIKVVWQARTRDQDTNCGKATSQTAHSDRERRLEEEATTLTTFGFKEKLRWQIQARAIRKANSGR